MNAPFFDDLENARAATIVELRKAIWLQRQLELLSRLEDGYRWN